MVICFQVPNESDPHSIQQNIQLRDQTAFRKERKIHNAEKFDNYHVIHCEIPEEVISNDSKARRTNSPTAFSYDPFKRASLNTTSLLFFKSFSIIEMGETAAFPSARRKKPQSHFFNQWKLGFKIRMITLALGSIQISPLGL